MTPLVSAIVLAAGSGRRMEGPHHGTPKTLLKIGHESLLSHTVESLRQLNLKEVQIVTGYQNALVENEVAKFDKGPPLKTTLNADFSTTGHAWSLKLAFENLSVGDEPVLIIHGDTYFDPEILNELLFSRRPNILAVDSKKTQKLSDRPYAIGENEIVTGLKVGGGALENSVGEVMCINLWSRSFFGNFINFANQFFSKNGRNWNWEPVLDAFIQAEAQPLFYKNLGAYSWVNINRGSDLSEAQFIFHRESKMRK